ncbi:hypothetical protein SBBP2_20063 [Burkholderiales bacterium]|nr:hypothetical protein SBBP2_20063 [Burkholderiales bacterium]
MAVGGTLRSLIRLHMTEIIVTTDKIASLAADGGCVPMDREAARSCARAVVLGGWPAGGFLPHRS